MGIYQYLYIPNFIMEGQILKNTIEKLKEEIKRILTDNEASIRMYFYTSDKKLFQPELINTTYGSIKKDYLDSLLNIIQKIKEISPFDLDGNLDNELVYLDINNTSDTEISDYINFRKLISNDICYSLEKKEIKSFYTKVKATIFIINNQITLIKKFSYPKKLLNNSVLNIQKYPLKQIKEDIFSIDNRIDAFEINNNVYILNNNSFEVIFSLETKYKKKIDDTISLLEDSSLMEGVEKFKEKCLGNKTTTKRLLKLLNKNNFNELKQRKELVQEVIDTYDLNINLSSEGKILYTGKEEIGEILNLLGDNYYVSTILKEKRLAKSSKEL